MHCSRAGPNKVELVSWSESIKGAFSILASRKNLPLHFFFHGVKIDAD